MLPDSELPEDLGDAPPDLVELATLPLPAPLSTPTSSVDNCPHCVGFTNRLMATKPTIIVLIKIKCAH